jgi:hypothetical protein
MTATTSPATGPALPHDEDPGDSFARTLEKICTWGGVAFAVLFGVGFVAIARFVPPLAPSDTAAETLALYRDHTNQIITGLLLCYVGTIGYLLFGSGILGQTRRIKNVPAAIVYLQVSCYAAASLLIILPITMWLTAAYRADEWAAESVQLLNDFGWISFVIGFPPFVTWFIATGLAILCDREPNPLYPRWAGFLSILMGFIQVSAVFLPYFKTGAFAWNGLFAWWIPMTDFFLWFVIITVLTLRAINRRDYAATPATSGS